MGIIANRDQRSFNNRTFSKKLHHALRAAAARKVMPGYPIETPFMDPDEVREYLHSDRITCLRCGKTYKSLALHLKVHDDWPIDRYRSFYGLPWRTGLTSSGTKKLQGDKARESSGLLKQTPEERAEVRLIAHQKVREGKVRSRAPYRDTLLKRYAAEIVAVTRENPEGFHQWGEADYQRVLDVMREKDMTMAEVTEDPRFPTRGSVRAYARAHPEFDKQIGETVEGLSYAAQARCYALGARFTAEATALRLSGMSFREIADQFGVETMSVANHLHAAGVPMPPPKPLATHCGRGHPYPESSGSRRRCEICLTEARRRRTGALPRQIAARTMVDRTCADCGAITKKSRAAGNRLVYCDRCLELRHRQIQKNWDTKHGGMRQAEYSAAWSRWKRYGDLGLLEAYVAKYPNGFLAKRWRAGK